MARLDGIVQPNPARRANGAGAVVAHGDLVPDDAAAFIHNAFRRLSG